MRNSIPSVLVFLPAVLVLASCAPGKSLTSSDSQKLLDAKTGKITEVTSGDPNDPMAQHLAARSKVNPSPTVSNDAYTKKATGDKPATEPMHFRVLKLESQMAEARGDVDKLLSTKEEPAPKIMNERTASADKQEHEMGDAGYVSFTSQEELAKKQLVEKEIAAKELANKNTRTASAPPVQKAVAPKETPRDLHALEPAAAPSSAPLPPAASGTPAVVDVRTGSHPGKVRIVLDVTEPVKYVATVDNGQKILLVEIPGAQMSGEQQKRLTSSLVSGYVSQTTDKGLAVGIALKEPSKLVLSTLLKGGPHGNRVVLDLSPQ